MPVLILKKLEEDIELLKNDFDSFNMIKESGRKFPFKLNFLKARFMLFKGIIHMNLDDYDLSYQKLHESETNLEETVSKLTYGAMDLKVKEILNFA